MRILHVYRDGPGRPGGIERHIELSCRYQQAWADVEVLACSRRPWPSTFMWRDIQVSTTAEFGRISGVPVAPGLITALKHSKADIIVLHSPNPSAELAWLIARPRARLVIRYHSDIMRQPWLGKLYTLFFDAVLRQAHAIVPSSQAYMESSRTLQPWIRKCTPIPLGITPEDFSQPDMEQVNSLRTRYGGDRGDFVLFSGRHCYYKGLEHLIRAAPKITAPVIIAGGGPYRKRCMKLARQIRAPVVFPGVLTDAELVNYLHACAIFVFPSDRRSEAFGLSLLEAHACHRPAVATCLDTGVEWVNAHGITGLNVKPGDPSALADAVNTLLTDHSTRKAMGDKARQRVETLFRADDVARREYELYASLLKAVD